MIDRIESSEHMKSPLNGGAGRGIRLSPDAGTERHRSGRFWQQSDSSPPKSPRKAGKLIRCRNEVPERLCSIKPVWRKADR